MGTRSRPRHVLLIVENVSLARDHRLRKQAAALSSAGYRVSIICRRDPANPALDGTRLYDYRAPRDAQSKLGYIGEYAYSLAMATMLATRVFIAHPFHAIQVSGTPDIYFTIGLPFRLLGRPLVLDQRDLSPELFEFRFGRRGLVHRVLCWLEKASYRSANHVVTVNGSLVDAALRRGGLPPERVTIVGNGPTLASSRHRRPKPKLKDGKQFLCCWLGIMGTQDHVDLALRAIDHLVHVRGRTDCRFTFIGDGECRTAAIALAAELGIDGFVDFPGWLTQEDAFAYLATADLGLEPNLEETVSPVKGMEYMAFGLPFVAFDLKETRRMAGDAAAYVAPGDAQQFARRIDELLDDPMERAEMGRIGRARVHSELSWENQEMRYLTVFEHLLSDGDGANEEAPRRGSVIRRGRHVLRARMTEHPALYLAFARRKYPGPSPEVIGPQTQLVIDAYTRSASTFAVYALQLAQDEPIRLAHHLHAPAQLIAAARRGVPALLIVREPQDAILSQAIREPDVAIRDALGAYARFHRSLLPYLDSFVIADFDTVTHDFASVVRRLNARFDLALREFEPTDENVNDCMELIKLRGTLSPILLGFESGLVTKAAMRNEQQRLHEGGDTGELREAWVPSQKRQDAKAELLAEYLRPELATLRREADKAYESVVQFAHPAGIATTATSARGDG